MLNFERLGNYLPQMDMPKSIGNFYLQEVSLTVSMYLQNPLYFILIYYLRLSDTCRNFKFSKIVFVTIEKKL